MGLRSNKAGTTFGKVNNARPEEVFAALIVKAAKQIGLPVETSLVARGLGTISAEGGFVKGPNWTSGRAKGPWAMEPEFPGSEAEHLDPWQSTLLAMQYVKSNGGNNARGFSAWWPFEESQGEAEGGLKRSAKYMGLAKKLVEAEGGSSGPGGILGALESVPIIGSVIEGGEDVVNASVDAEEFLQHALETLLDFKKLGTLAVHAFAWFIRLLAKAIWDYVIAPLVHWTERAVEWYWTNFFETGTERGSGFGYQIRNNAGIITIVFWSLGYAILWSDGSGSMVPVASHNTMLGQAVKGIEGAVARRNLVKPSDVKDKTPKKPPVKKSSVMLEQVDEFSVNRPRPVKVTRPGASESKTGRVSNGRQRQQRQLYSVPRPTSQQREQGGAVQSKQTGEQRQISERTQKAKATVPTETATPNTGTRTVPRVPRSASPKGNRGSGEPQRRKA